MSVISRCSVGTKFIYFEMLKNVRTFEWTDRDTYETIRLVAKAYHRSVSVIIPSGPRHAKVTLSGDEDSLARLSCDMRILGAPEPFITECSSSRTEYLFWLQSELNGVGVNFTPKFTKLGKAAV